MLGCIRKELLVAWITQPQVLSALLKKTQVDHLHLDRSVNLGSTDKN